MNSGESVTLDEARAFVGTHSKDGISCPCCGRLVKIYKRKLSAEMVVFLFALCKEYDGNYVDIREMNDWVYQRGDYAYLRYWDLIDHKPGDEPGKRGNAHWKPTLTAFNFITGVIKLPKRVHLLYGKLMGFSDEMTTVREALGEKFNYDELMKGEYDYQEYNNR